MIRRYMKVVDVIAVHDRQIEVFGGGVGLRDKGALESAIHRPQTGYYTDLLQEAAAFWESLPQNHPFVDGNKRTAIVSTFAFLKVNGVQLTATDTEALIFVRELYEAGQVSMSNLESWLRTNTMPL